MIGAQNIAGGFRAKFGKGRIGVELGARPQMHETETAGIIIDDTHRAGWGRQVKDDVIVFFILGARMMEIAGQFDICSFFYTEGTGHAEMGDDGGAVIEIDQQIFRTAAKGCDALARYPICKVFRKGKPQIRTTKLKSRDRCPFHHRREASTDGFDLWQFGHGFPNFLFQRPADCSIDQAQRRRMRFIT